MNFSEKYLYIGCVAQCFLQLKHFCIYDHSIHMFIVFIIHLIEQLKRFLDIFVVRMFWLGMLKIVFQQKNIFRETLHWLDEKGFYIKIA